MTTELITKDDPIPTAHGGPEAPPTAAVTLFGSDQPALWRFWTKVALGDECWNWLGANQGGRNGYGLFRYGGDARLAHRLAYEQFNGPIPPDLQLDHLCRNPACVRPDHLEAVTCRVNVLRGHAPAATNATLTHCRRGHKFTEANTIRWHRKRFCRSCANAGARARRAKAKR